MTSGLDTINIENDFSFSRFAITNIFFLSFLRHKKALKQFGPTLRLNLAVSWERYVAISNNKYDRKV